MAGTAMHSARVSCRFALDATALTEIRNVAPASSSRSTATISASMLRTAPPPDRNFAVKCSRTRTHPASQRERRSVSVLRETAQKTTTRTASAIRLGRIVKFMRVLAATEYDRLPMNYYQKVLLRRSFEAGGGGSVELLTKGRASAGKWVTKDTSGGARG